MEKAVHSRPVSDEDEALSCGKKLRLEGKYEQTHSEEEEMQKLNEVDYKLIKTVECSPVSQDTGKYTLFIDSRYKLPLYLCEFALVEFNANQKAMYEKVNVLETRKSLNVSEGTTYLITFEASLPDDMSNNAQTFQTKMFMSLLDSTTNIDIKFVRIKLSEFDCNDEEDSQEKVSESDEEEEEEEEKVSESDTEGSESDEEEEDTEENLSETDEKDTELKLSESDKKDCEQEKLSEFDEDDSYKQEELLESDDEELYSNKMKQYHIDVEKSDGFEVGYYPRARTPCCMIRRYYDPPARTQCTINLNRLVYLSQLAICVYNMKEDTHFDNVKVLKAMAFGCGCTNYNITFEASLSDGSDVTFQTRIYTSVPLPCRNIEINFVRIKPSIIPLTSPSDYRSGQET